jgi:hypothetical protein
LTWANPTFSIIVLELRNTQRNFFVDRDIRMSTLSKYERYVTSA